MEIILLFNRSGSEYYPEEFTLSRNDDFFSNGYNFCLLSNDNWKLHHYNIKHKDRLPVLKDSDFLLIYDGIDGEYVDDSITISALKKSISKSAHLLCCYHANSDSQARWMPKIERAFPSNLRTDKNFRNIENDPICIAIGQLLIGNTDLNSFKASVFGNVKSCPARQNLKWKPDEAYFLAIEQNDTTFLDTNEVKDIVIKCNFSDSEMQLFLKLKELVKTKANKDVFDRENKKFQTLILSGCN